MLKDIFSETGVKQLKVWHFSQNSGEIENSNHKLISKSTYLPVEVHVAQFVGKPLHVIRLQSAGVVHYVVVGWGDTSIGNSLTYDVEIIPSREGYSS